MNTELTTVDITVSFKKKKPTTTKLNKLICWWTKSKYFHVELIIGGKWISSNPDTGGVTIHNLEQLNDNWDYCKLPTITLTTQQYDRIMKWIESQSPKKYDWAGIIFSQVFPFTLHNRNKWFCSELCTTILKLFLVQDVLDAEPNNVSPGDLARLLKFER